MQHCPNGTVRSVSDASQTRQSRSDDVANATETARHTNTALRGRVAVCSGCCVHTASAASRSKVRVGDKEERARDQHDGEDRGHADDRRILTVVRLLDLCG